jgi:hypothetical protein
MISSCSDWIVVTMSRMRVPRGAVSAASSAGSDADDVAPGRPPSPSSRSSWKATTRSRGAVPATV